MDTTGPKNEPIAEARRPETPAVPVHLAPPHEAHHHGHHFPIELKFLEQLKRRNVGRVGLLYIAVAYIVLEVFELFFHLLEMPAWAGRATVILAILGFPVALVIAWAYEVTPEGLKPTDEVPPEKSMRVQTGRRLDRAIIGVLAVALGYFVIDKFWLSHRMVERSPALAAAASSTSNAPPSPTAIAVPEKSVAVLPFVDMSEKHDQEYFSDGLSEELIDMLTKVPDLRVPARTSSFYFKSRSDDVPTIAKRLLVAHVLEGSVRKSGNRIRVTAQLVRADNGYHLWSETYDRKFDDIFRIQDEIAGAVVRALRVSLLGSPVTRPAPTRSSEAYTLYVQARAIFRRRTDAAYRKAYAYLLQSLTLDPGFAAAWAELAKVRVRQSFEGYVPRAQADAEARHAALQALRLDPMLPEAHLSMARVLFQVDWDLMGADAQVKQVTALDPGNADAYRWAAMVAAVAGNPEAAVGLYTKAIERDPLEPLYYDELGELQGGLGEYRQAEASYRRARDLNPDFPITRDLALLQMARGAPAAALTLGAQQPGVHNFIRALAYHALGRTSDADAALAELKRQQGAGIALDIARVYAFRGEVDPAFGWLDRAYDEHDTLTRYIKTDPLLRNLHADPRYKALLHRMNLPDRGPQCFGAR